MAMADTFELVSRNDTGNTDDSVGAKLAREVTLIGMAADRLPTAIGEQMELIKEDPLRHAVKPIVTGMAAGTMAGFGANINARATRVGLVAGAAFLAADFAGRASGPMVDVWNDPSKLDASAAKLSQVVADTAVTDALAFGAGAAMYRISPLGSSKSLWDTEVGSATDSLRSSGAKISAESRGINVAGSAWDPAIGPATDSLIAPSLKISAATRGAELNLPLLRRPGGFGPLES